MARPRAVEEGAKRSRELIEQMKKDQQEAEQANKAAVEQHLADLNRPDTESPAQAQTEPRTEGDQTSEAQGQANPPPERPREPGDRPQQNQGVDGDIQKRFQELEAENARLVQANTVLRSKYDAEVPRLAAELRTLKEQLKQQTTPPAGDTAKPAAANTEAVEKIKQALLDEYPSDVVDNLEQLIRQHVAAGLPAQGSVTDGQVQELQQQVQTTMARLRDQQLTTLVPDWQKIQASEQSAWVKFLQYVDPVSGRERNDFLQEAWNGHDVERVAEIFNLYKRERDTSKTSGREPPPPGPDDRGARSNPNPADPGKKVYTRSYISSVEKMANRGEFRGREAELNRLRQEFRLAAAEGRVDPNG